MGKFMKEMIQSCKKLKDNGLEKDERGFTLIELLAVIAIIAILGVTVVAGYNSISQRSKEKAYEAKISQIEVAAIKWAKENNVNYKTEVSVNKLIVQGYLQADTISDDGKTTIANPIDNSNMVCYVIDLSRTKGDYDAKVSKTKKNCSLAQQALYDEQIIVEAVDANDNKVNFRDNYLEWTNKNISLFVSSEEFDAKAVSISFDFEGETITKEKSGKSKYVPTGGKYKYQANDSTYYNVFNVSAELILNSNVVITYTLNDGSMYSRIVNVRIDKEPATFVAESVNEWLSVEKPLTVYVDDGEGSGVKGFYVSSDKNNKGTRYETDYKKEVAINSVGTYYVWTEDNAGNVYMNENLAIKVNNIDTSKPNCEIEFVGTKNDKGWYKDDVIPRAKSSKAGISGLYLSISKSSSPDYKQYVAADNIGVLDANKQQETPKTGTTYYCFVESLAGIKNQNYAIVKVDKTKPKLSVSPTTDNENTVNKNVKISIEDALSGLNNQNSIKYAWSLDKNTVPTEWMTFSMEATAQSNNVTSKILTANNLTGEYYLWIKGATISDYAGNANDSEDKVYGPYVFSATVTYDGNGHTSGETAATICPYNEECTLAENGFKKTGYNYVGWYTEAIGGTKYGTKAVFTKNTTIYAHWEPKEYTLTYNNQSGSGCSTQKGLYDSTWGTLCTPTRTGYTFMGWYTKANGQGEKVTKDTKVKGNLTVYAYWKANEYTLTYNNQSGSGCSTQKGLYDSTWGTLCTPTRTGYTFKGWYTSANGQGEKVTKDTKVKGNLTVYAYWQINSYTLTFKSEGGSSCSSITKNYNQAWGTLCTPTRTGYTFKGWYTKTNGQGTQITSASLAPANNLTVYAKWTANTYTISYGLNSGSYGTSHPTSGTYDTNVTISNPTKKTVVSFNANNTGASISKTQDTVSYTFKGWTATGLNTSTAKAGGSSWNGTDKSTATTFKNLRSTSGTVVMTANWTASTITLPTISKTGYTCKWNTNSGGSGTTYNPSASYTPAANSSTSIPLYAICTANNYKLTYDPNGGTGCTSALEGTYGTSWGTLCTPTRTGYTFNGWNTNLDGSGTKVTSSSIVSGNTKVYAQWTVNKYTLTYTEQCNKTYHGTCTKTCSPKSKEGTYGSSWGTLCAPESTGYVFSNWNTNSAGTGTKVTSSTTVSGNSTVYGQWTPITYNISYALNNGSYGTNHPTSATYGSNVNISYPTRSTTINLNLNGTGASSSGSSVTSNFTFTGWSSSSADGLNISTALYTSNLSSWNGGSVGAQIFRNLRSTAGTVKLSANWTANAVTLPTISKTGYSCKWNTNSGGSGTSYNSGASYTPAANAGSSVTLYAICSINKYTLTYNNGGSSCTSVTKDYNQTWGTLCTPPSVTGKTFKGWNTNSAGSGTYITSSSKATANISVYPIYTNNTYSIAYALNNGSYGTSHPTSATYGSNVTISNPTKSITVKFNANSQDASISSTASKTKSYTFSGWTATGLNTSTALAGGSSWKGTTATKNTTFKNLNSSGGTVTMTATWTAPTITLPTISKTGYTCKWYKNSGGTGTSYNSGGSYKPAANDSTSVTLYAKCTVNSYTIAYDKYVGTVSTQPTSATYGKNVTISNPTKSITVTFNKNNQNASISSTKTLTGNYTFNGWTATGLDISTAKAGGASWSGTDKTKATTFKNLRTTSGTVTMTSNWKRPKIDLPTVTKTGYTCKWNNKSDGSGDITSDSGGTYSPVSATSRNFYAYCTANTYTIEYAGGGTVSTNPTSATYGKNVTISNPTKSITVTFNKNNQNASISSTKTLTGNYTFNGWTATGLDTSTAKAGGASWSGTDKTKETIFKNLRTTSGTVTMTANWEKPNVKFPTVKKSGYTCKWVSSDGKVIVESGGTYTPSTATKRTFLAQCSECSKDNPTACEVYYTCREGKTMMYDRTDYATRQNVVVYSGTKLYKIAEEGSYTYFYAESYSEPNDYYKGYNGKQNYGWIYNVCLTNVSTDYCPYVQCPDNN